MNLHSKIQQIISNNNHFNFEEVAIEIFRYQYKNNNIYKQFTDHLQINIFSVNSIEKIPFLPIHFFKTHKIAIQPNIDIIFESSGTTNSINSKHFVNDISIYKNSFINGFKQFYGNIENWNILALLPSYLERNNSSLVYMTNHLIQLSNSKYSGFYLHNFDDLHQTLQELKNHQKPTLLIGVTFALLDFAEQFPSNLSHITIMETGGMKGRKEEITRNEVHDFLKSKLQTQNIHSEYGMTELLSQAYSTQNGIFETPKWIKILRRDFYNPLSCTMQKGRGIINVIDFANINSCSFIATQDVCMLHQNGTFEVLGRTDNSDIRGCNLMVSSF